MVSHDTIHKSVGQHLKKMNRNNKIVRTKKTFNLYDSKERQYFKTELMTFDNYIKEYNWKVNGQKFELYPYK